MLAELVLVTRLLGLVSGDYPVTIYVHPSIASVDLIRNGQKIGTVNGAPWQTIVNFGPELVPQELTAVAFDASGKEVGRDTQLVNLPRPAAEAAIDLRREEETMRATVKWQHIGSARVRDIVWKLDGKNFGNGQASELLPRVEPRKLHVVEAEVVFWDNVVARKERVFGGIFSEEVPTELTAALVRVAEGSSDPANCFRLGDRPVPAVAVEKSESMVVFVRNPDPTQARRTLRTITREASGIRYKLASDLRILWPTATAVVEEGRRSVANLFEHSQIIPGSIGIPALLSGKGGPKVNEHRYADAVAVSGVYAALGGRRRAVVLVIGNEKDKSKQNPAVVRRYLERIGVPLQVWSLVLPKKETIAAWGEVIDVSNGAKLHHATVELQKELDRQRVAWLPLEPLEALKIQAAEGCGFLPVAKP
jgi:hypothetical protein